MITPKTLNDAVINAINARISDELTAHYFYNAAHNWCSDKNYKNATSFFAEETSNELEHAQKLQKYLVDWNATPLLENVTMNFEFTSLPDIIEKAYKLELDLLDNYVKDSQSIFGIDLTTFDFLQEFRKIQNDSVIEYSDLLAGLELIDVNSKLDILHYDELYLG